MIRPRKTVGDTDIQNIRILVFLIDLHNIPDGRLGGPGDLSLSNTPVELFHIDL